MIHVTDELELYALGALAPGDSARVAAHLSECPACREQARAIDEVVQELPETLPDRDAPGVLRERILATAKADLSAERAPRRDTAWLARLLRPGLVFAAVMWIAVGAAAVVNENLALSNQLKVVAAERASYESIVEGIRQGGRWWYMSGKDQWTGSGGTLIAPRVEGRPPFVVFHDLKPLPQTQMYTIWLVSADNTWVRGANFRPDGKDVQAVDVTAPIVGFDRCAVTIENSAWGRRAGPVVMESRIVAPAPQ
ncbi:MAG TPA: anti-sigma factor [Candidatus Limnocylindria bacterium]